MTFPLRPVAFILVASNHGSMIVNRNDYRMVDASSGIGVGFQVLNKSSFDESEVNFMLALLNCRRQHFGEGVVAIDGGANIGVHTIEWARHMYGWGRVIAFEAQEIIYYALAGNVALNNCLNARVRLAALGETCGELNVPQPNYFKPASFGSLELRKQANTEFIGQEISYDNDACATVQMVNLDSLGLVRLDLIKIDVEGMELDVLRGGQAILTSQHPIMLIEVIKSNQAALETYVMELGYRVFHVGINLLAIHTDDPTLRHIKQTENLLTIMQ